MQNGLTIFIIASFIGIAVFGFLAMGDHGPEHNFGGCIAALQGETDCSVFNGFVGFASFHLNAFKVFSSANLVVVATSLLFFLTAFIFSTVLIKRLFDFGFSDGTLAAVTVYSADHDFCTPLERNLRSWFALHENSPTTQ